MSMKLDSISDAIAAIAAGRPIIVVDDEDRENEGDLVLAAAKTTPEWMAFLVRHTSGIICAPLPASEARRLSLQPMVADNDAPLSTAFTVSVDYREGLTTGISADERTATVRALANNNCGPRDFVRPGHIFPLIARDGGVLIRTGHTEASVDFARLAGLPPVGVIGELVNDDGTVKKGKQLEAFAREHKLLLVSIDDLIAYRQQRERLITRVSRTATATAIGPAEAVVYSTPFDAAHHVAVVFGEIGEGKGLLARLHREDTIGDVFWAGSSPIHRSLEKIRAEGRGVVIYLREGAVGVIAEGKSGESGSRSRALKRHEAWREIGLGAQILKDLGVRSIRVIGTRERQYVGLAGFGVEIEGTEIIEG
jgi:3,4-dihydroxy 2-butanone 4-phosphate synthase/GTP cyclohydrolase II